ncbi:hypothetical protein FPV67DRAFT_1670315 [Lyophyllum atratum]|nr:hypothetical protein FPV67DRAFT_1670315 [Lyophyllum atratum]
MNSNPGDSRRFSTPRLASLAGYDDPPVVDSSLRFKLPLPTIRQHSGRFVRGQYEVWSPNSGLIPFLPGLPPPSFTGRIPVDSKLRRFDGHLGPFDDTVSPQMLTGKPWVVFVLRPKIGQARMSEFPEHEFIHQNWVSTPSATALGATRGNVNPAYIERLANRNRLLDSLMAACVPLRDTYTDFWDRRPSAPSAMTVDGLGAYYAYEDAVDYGVEIQRQIKHKAAWIRFANRLLEHRWLPAIESVRREGIARADDEFLGAWINGDREEEALWLLSQRIPCFLVHKLTNTELWVVNESSFNFPSWRHRTDVEELGPTTNGYDFVAHRNQSAVTQWVAPLPAATVVATEEEMECTSATAQGWRGPDTGPLVDAPVEIPRPYSPINFAPQEKEPIPNEATRVPPMYEVVLASDRVPWIRPPPVADNQGQSGTWTKYVLDDEGRFKRVGAKTKPDEEYTMYDRERRRVLHFSLRLPVPRGLVSPIKIFGRPVPGDWTFWNARRQEMPSTWLYSSMYAERHHAGTTFGEPGCSELPLLPVSTAESGAEASSGGMAPERLALPAHSEGLGNSDLAPERSALPTLSRVPDTPSATVPVLTPFAHDEDESISLGSTPSPERDMLVDEDVHEMFLRSTSFSLECSWTDIRERILSLAQIRPEVHVLRIALTVTQAQQTLWIATTTVEGARSLRDAYLTVPMVTGAPERLVGSNATEFRQAGLTARENWTAPLPSPMTSGRCSLSPMAPPVRRRRSPSPDVGPSRPRWDNESRHYRPPTRPRSPSPHPSHSRYRRWSPSARRYRPRSPVRASPRRRSPSRSRSPVRHRYDSSRSRSRPSRWSSPSPQRATGAPPSNDVPVVPTVPAVAVATTGLAQVLAPALLDRDPAGAFRAQLANMTVLEFLMSLAPGATSAIVPAPVTQPADPVVPPSLPPPSASLSSRLTEAPPRRPPLDARFSNPTPLSARLRGPSPPPATLSRRLNVDLAERMGLGGSTSRWRRGEESDIEDGELSSDEEDGKPGRRRDRKRGRRGGPSKRNRKARRAANRERQMRDDSPDNNGGPSSGLVHGGAL